MTDIQTCKACGEAKPLDAFETLSSGRPRGTCKACRLAVASARKRTAREAAAHTQRVSNARHRLREEIRSDLRAAMHTGRSRRACTVARLRPDASHRLRMKDGTGYISISEFACRCLEREAVHRATRVCKTHADTPEFIRELQQDTSGLDRSRRMNQLARDLRPQVAARALASPATEQEDADPFAPLWGDWSPVAAIDIAFSPANA